MTDKQDEQRLRLITALSESQDSERAWRSAVAEDARATTKPTAAMRRRLNQLWRERERARLRLVDLRWVDPATLKRAKRRSDAETSPK